MWCCIASLSKSVIASEGIAPFVVIATSERSPFVFDHDQSLTAKHYYNKTITHVFYPLQLQPAQCYQLCARITTL